MQEVLNELFYGNINPNSKQFARNSEYGKAVKIVSDCEEKLLALLTGKELELFEKLMKENGESSFIHGREYFVDGYGFNSATRFINQNRDDLYMSKSRYYDDISFRVSKVTDWDKERLVSEQDIELYDISLYPVPWDESMSYEMQEIVSNPLFKGEDLTLDMVKKREYVRGEEGDPSGNSVCMRFCVLYGDVMIEIMTEGIGARELFDELKKLPYN